MITCSKYKLYQCFDLQAHYALYSREAWVCPVIHLLVLYKPEKLTFAKKGVNHIQPAELIYISTLRRPIS
jgi:hypothetical protein